jgi:hypothetical protein
VRLFDRAFILAFFAFAALPVASSYLDLAPPHGLEGVVQEPEVVPLSTQSFLSGQFQQSFEQRFDASLGFRGVFVRADNELNLRVFEQIGMNPRTSTLIGEYNHLFSREYVDAYLRHDAVPLAVLDEKVQRVRRVQDFLESRGTLLLVLITPSKPHLSPEHLPEAYRRHPRQGLPTNYELFTRLVAKHGVNTLDAQAYLQDWKNSATVEAFPLTGTHWNDVAACEVTARLAETIGHLRGSRLPRLTCGPYSQSERPTEVDIDIWRISNVWFEERLYRPSPLARVRWSSRGKKRPPHLLFVGGSFVWPLLRNLGRAKITDNTFYRYYSSRHYRGRTQRLDRTRIDWEQDVFSNDVLVLEINASQVQNVGWGIVEDIERAMSTGRQ